MYRVLHPWHLLLWITAGWVNRRMQAVIDYQHTEIQILKERLGRKRLLLNDEQRRRLAVKGKALGHKLLQQFATLFTPDTILRWHRELIARKWDYTDQRQAPPGRPPVPDEVRDLVLQMAAKTPVGATSGFKEPWPIWVMRSRTARSPTSSRQTDWSLLRRVASGARGKRFSRPTSRTWPASISRRWRSGHPWGW
jgi:hypothetical protein